MSGLSRRDAVRLVAATTFGASGLAAVSGQAEDPKPAAGPKREADPPLQYAIENPLTYMFAEQVTFQLQGDGYSRDLEITSARDPEGHPVRIRVRPASMQIFRADASLDLFTRQGGIYWRFHKTEGKLQFREPGAIVLILRDQDDTVRCYTLVPDERC